MVVKIISGNDGNPTAPHANGDVTASPLYFTQSLPLSSSSATSNCRSHRDNLERGHRRRRQRTKERTGADGKADPTCKVKDLADEN